MKLKKEDDQIICEVNKREGKLYCFNCGNKINNGNIIFVCELNTKYVYCSCWSERGSSVCENVLKRNHQDIRATLRII